jgi:hypothetical protein
MTQTFQVQVYPEMSFHWKSQGLILLIIVCALVVGYFVLPEWIVHNRFFFMLALAPIVYFVYTKYLNKAYSYAQETLTITDNRVSFRHKNYSKSDVGFYRYKLRGATYGTVIKLGQDVALMCGNMDLPNHNMYEGDSSKHTNLAIERDAFDALTTLKFNHA